MDRGFGDALFVFMIALAAIFLAALGGLGWVIWWLLGAG